MVKYRARWANELVLSGRARRRRRRFGVGDFPLRGRCNCGAVQFEISEPLVTAWYCHCKRCQRRTGTAASVNAAVAPGTFRIIAGEKSLRVWNPTDGREKWFCGECGSALFSSGEDRAEPIGIRMGAFDRDPEIRPSARVFTDYAAPWEPIPDDGLTSYGENLHRGS